MWTQRRRLNSIPYQGAFQQIPVDRDGVLGFITIRLGYTITNAATGPVGPLWQALARLIRRVRLQLEGQDTVIDLPGEVIASRQLYEYGARAPGMDATVVLTASAVTNYNVRLTLPMFLPRARRPDDTSLDLRQFTNVTLTVDWGTIADIFATPNGAAISNVVCEPEAYYLMGENPRASTGTADKPYLVRQLDTLFVPVTATNPRFQIKIDGGMGILHRGFHIVGLVNNVANDALLDGGQFTLDSGGRTWINREAISVRQDAQSDFGLVPAEIAAAVGTYRLDLTHYGQMSTAINSSELTGDLNLRVGTTLQGGTNQIVISREGIRPVRA